MLAWCAIPWFHVALVRGVARGGCERVEERGARARAW